MTFLPYKEFNKSAIVLDGRRLGKQRSESKILINGGWPYHPISKMWANYKPALIKYTWEICKEWRNRGYKDTVYLFLINTAFEEGLISERTVSAMNDLVFTEPKWLGNPFLHASHRSNLLRKLPNYYSQFGWTEPDNLPYLYLI